MDFKELKDNWEALSKLQENQKQFKEQEIRQLLEQRSQQAVGELKKSLGLEILLLLGLTLLFAITYRWLPPELAKPLLMVFIIVWPFAIAIFSPTYIQLKNIFQPDVSLKDNLYQLVRKLDLSIKVNKFLATIAPAVGYLSGFFIYNDIADNTMDFLKNGVIALILCAIFFPLVSWYLNKLYGTHVRELKQCLKDFE